MTSALHVEITKPIATLRLVDAKRACPIAADWWRALAVALDDLSARSDVACVVVCGTGGAPSWEGTDVAPGGEQDDGDAAAITRALLAIRGCPHPTVAVVEGICVGGGLVIAACCDLRVCAESSRFGAPIDGLGPSGLHGGVAPLAQLLGKSRVLEMLSSGEMIDADQASRFGLVNRVYPDATVLAQGYGLAARIAAGAPLVNLWHKKLIRRLDARFPLGEAQTSNDQPERRCHH